MWSDGYHRAEGNCRRRPLQPNPCWPIDTTFCVVDPDPEVLRFKYYLLKSLDLEHMNADSAVRGLNRDAAHALKISVPPVPKQLAIAHILGTLDDKIELNRRMRETLEAMALALFKAWFVDFKPVRAKTDGRWQRNNPLPLGRGVGPPAFLKKTGYDAPSGKTPPT